MKWRRGARDPGKERVRSRAQALNPEERRAGTDDAEVQAATILRESDARMVDRLDPPGQPVEHRRSEDTVDLVDVNPVDQSDVDEIETVRRAGFADR